jgi:hypothetical protein
MTLPIGPEKKYGPRIANLLRSFAKEVQAESKANGIKISCEFVYWADASGKDGGELRVVTHVTPDARTERLDGGLKPRGNKLQVEVDHALRDQINKLRRK